MKRTLRLFGFLAALILSSASQATLYNYSYTFDMGSTLSGSFEGTANGNLIINLTNITASYNGLAFVGSGSLYGSHSVGFKWISGDAVASFDGKQSNFMFVDADYPTSPNYKNYFYIMDGNADGLSDGVAAHLSTGQHIVESDLAYHAGHWSVVAADVAPVPEPESLALVAAGLLAAALVRKSAKRGGSVNA